MIKPLRNISKSLGGILVLGLVLRLSLFFVAQPWDSTFQEEELLYRDAIRYHVMAIELIEQGAFGEFSQARTPIYPIFISAIYSVFGQHPWVVLLFQIFISIGSILLVYKIARLWFNEKIALLAAGLMAIDPYGILYTQNLLTETIFVFLLLLGIYCALKLYHEQKLTLGVLSGIILALATLTRPISFYFPLILLFIFILAPQLKLRKRIGLISLFGLLYLGGIGVWCLHNYQQYGHFKISSNTPRGLLTIAARIESRQTGGDVIEIREQHQTTLLQQAGTTDFNSFQAAEYYQQYAQPYIRKNFSDFTALSIIGLGNIYTGLSTNEFGKFLRWRKSELPYNAPSERNWTNKIQDFLRVKSPAKIVLAFVIGPLLLALYWLFLIGAFRLLKDKQYFILATILMIIVFFTLISSPIGSPRYRLPFMPFVMMTAAYGWYQLKRWKRVKT